MKPPINKYAYILEERRRVARCNR